MLIDETSLSATIDAFNAQLAEDARLDAEEEVEVVSFLLGRQIGSGRNGGMFALSAGEYEAGVHLFTGERLRTRIAARSVLTLGATRILSAIGGDRVDVQEALARASAVMRRACFAAAHCVIGECAHSSIAYMRDAAIDRTGARRKWIEDHIRVICAHREGNGRWKRFPFYYTLLALSEVGTPSANAELDYARPACERVVRRASTGVYGVRRKSLLRRVLGDVDQPLELL